MKEITTYICDTCGMTFEDKEECRQHENEHKNWSSVILAWDKNHQKIKFEDTLDFIDRVYAFRCLSVSAAAYLSSLFSSFGCDNPFAGNINHWDDIFYWDEEREGTWVDLDKELLELQKLYKSFN